MLTPDEVAAKMWDDYLHRFGAEAYVMVRYISTLPTMPTNERGLPLAPDGREEPQSPSRGIPTSTPRRYGSSSASISGSGERARLGVPVELADPVGRSLLWPIGG